ncbi:MAG: CapA family protein [Actinomycetales bacterium]|nr:CapA family protein [Actinomycetales bacterium]
MSHLGMPSGRTRSARLGVGAIGYAVLLTVAACTSSPVATPSAPLTGTGGVSTGPVASKTGAAAASPAPTNPAPTNPTPTNPTQTSPAGARTVSITVGGDVLLHEGVVNQARADAKTQPAGASNGLNFRPMFAEVRSTIAKADVAICNLETPLAPAGGPYTGYPTFSVPQDVVPALKDTGFDACTTASNHTVDKGFAGLSHTLDVLDANGLKHAGSNRSLQERNTPAMMDVRGVKVALLAYGYGLNGLPMPAGKPWAVNLIDIPTMLADAKAARAAGAQIVAVAIHGGDEYVSAPNAQQRSAAKALAESGDVDLIYGHHVHVLQPIDKIGDVWVAYGMGNFVHKQHSIPKLKATQAESLATFTFTEGSDGRFRATAAEARPIAMAETTERLRLVDLPTLLADKAVTGARRTAYQALYDRSVTALLALGANAKGLTIVKP